MKSHKQVMKVVSHYLEFELFLYLFNKITLRSVKSLKNFKFSQMIMNFKKICSPNSFVNLIVSRKSENFVFCIWAQMKIEQLKNLLFAVFKGDG